VAGAFSDEVEEYFAEQLSPGDTFVFGGEVLQLSGHGRERGGGGACGGRDPKVPSFMGGKFPLSTHLAARVRAMLADTGDWPRLPPPVRDWLEQQRRVGPAGQG
jgi:ATP-dependent Lhr-like helicase